MHYNEIYTEGDYFYFNKNKLNLKFISKYYRFSSPNDIKGIVSYDEDIKILLSDTKEITDFNIEFSYNRNIKNSGFRLKLNPKKEVIIIRACRIFCGIYRSFARVAYWSGRKTAAFICIIKFRIFRCI